MLPSQSLPLVSPGAGFDLLAGVRVLDLTSSVAGPYAGQLLADFGADVVKIERPAAGDDVRAWGPPFIDGSSLWYLAVNRNKRSLALDPAGGEGRELLMKLVGAAEVVLVNQLARVQRKLGLDYQSLSAVRPGLIHASITGFGLEGQRTDMPCYDLIAEGYSGVMDLTGESGREPQKVGTPAADLLAGQDAAMAVLAALVRKQRTGQGCMIDVALVDSMTRFMTPRIMAYLGSGEVPHRSGGRDSVIAIYQVFQTKDKLLTLGLGNDRIWGKFWSCVGEEAYGGDPRLASNAGRREHRSEVVERIQRILRSQSRAHWLGLFAKAGVPAGPINSIDEVCADPVMARRGVLYRVAGTREEGVPQVGLSIQIDGRHDSYRCPPPGLGADLASVTADWLGA
ncbi:CaiB/BaiF CoA transferase family protein [Variovorax ginsengisoli]|uniref:CoA transferase n=1 Tax=Variovorax ginsengisoli TaxID=363844 RepID=A0ABT8SF35_9BURK|nr:CoA transferase [Variovorax ginsengisoli]MDN8618190.1 CoA transferase [Variovorax ginsengisoli]MDO1537360.1 CoA transferase [Variovorax ginsengisoli]